MSVVLVNYQRRRRHDHLPRRRSRDARLAGRPARDHRRRQRVRRRQRRADPRRRTRTSRSSSRRRTLGFAGGCNLGVARGDGEYLAFLNNDARPDPHWLARRGRRARARRPTSRAWPARCSTGTATTIDFVDAVAVLLRHGLQAATSASPTSAAYDERARRAVRHRRGDVRARRASSVGVGGFDERYFMFFEDVDLGWRLYLLGYRVRYVPDVARLPPPPRVDGEVRAVARALPARAQRALHDLQELRRRAPARACLPAALALAVRRGVALGGVDPHALDLAARRSGDEPTTRPRGAQGRRWRRSYAIDAFVEQLPIAATSRATSCRRPGAAATTSSCRCSGSRSQPDIADPRYLDGLRAPSSTAFDIEEMFARGAGSSSPPATRSRPQMAGPAIRGLADRAARCRASTTSSWSTLERCEHLTHPDFECRTVDRRRAAPSSSSGATSSSSRATSCSSYPWLLRQPARSSSPTSTTRSTSSSSSRPRDLRRGRPRATSCVDCDRRRSTSSSTRGDFFLCARDKQRDFWLGQLAAVGRVNPVTYDADETLRVAHRRRRRSA